MLAETVMPLPPDAVAALEREIAAGSKRRLFGGGGREGRNRAAIAARCLEEGTCTSVTIRHDVPPVVASHEHGLIVLIPRDDATTHLLDISSVADDPRWDLHQAGTLWRHEWQWLRLDELGPLNFTASGPPIETIHAGDLHGTRLEEELVERDEGWPGDDARLDMPFAAAAALLNQPQA